MVSVIDLEEYKDRGRDSVCPVCGKEWHINYTDMWAYKREARSENGNHPTIYLCGYGCTMAYDRQREEEKKREFEMAEGKVCGKCRYFSTDMYGFYDCSASAIVVNPIKKGCRKFKEIVKR